MYYCDFVLQPLYILTGLDVHFRYMSKDNDMTGIIGSDVIFMFCLLNIVHLMKFKTVGVCILFQVF
jgi:hypothetical protein